MMIAIPDEDGATLELSYEVTERNGFYGAGVTLNGGREHASATFLKSKTEAEALCNTLSRSSVTPSTFFDVIQDFLCTN